MSDNVEYVIEARRGPVLLPETRPERTSTTLDGLPPEQAYRLGALTAELIAEAEARGYQRAIDAQDVRAEVLKTAARALLAEAEAYDAKWLRQIRQPDTSDWDKGYVAGLKRAAHDVANSIDRPVTGEASAHTYSHPKWGEHR